MKSFIVFNIGNQQNPREFSISGSLCSRQAEHLVRKVGNSKRYFEATPLFVGLAIAFPQGPLNLSSEL